MPESGRRDEIGLLARGLNGMSAALVERTRELQAATAARERANGELRIARQIQAGLLPPSSPGGSLDLGVDLHAVNLAASHVAGDFYDYFIAPDGRLAVLAADVSGKGVPAALVMAATRAQIRTLTMEGAGMARVVERVNQMLLEDTATHLFVTLFALRYDPATGRIEYVNAGHPQPLRLTPAGMAAGFGGVTCPILGVMSAEEMGEVVPGLEVLESGESLVLFTDGVTEARGSDRRLFEDAELASFLRGLPAGATAKEVCDRLVDRVLDYGGNPPRDDVTVVCLRRQA